MQYWTRQRWSNSPYHHGVTFEWAVYHVHWTFKQAKLFKFCLFVMQILSWVFTEAEFRVRITPQGSSPASRQGLQPLCGSLYVSGKPEQPSTCGPAEYSEAICSLSLDPRVPLREAAWELVQAFSSHGPLLPGTKLTASCKHEPSLTWTAL